MPGALETPVGADEFAALIEGIAPSLSSPIMLAVSGGPDSMALALCVKRWGRVPAIALIVDHRLRKESAAEADQTKSWLENIGIPAEILTWTHDPVTGGLHEKAREARHALLREACRRHGSKTLLLAHHRDDQAETILMRLAKGSGVEGLAGMSARHARDGIDLVRPFLSLPKERLIATCHAAKLPFVTDPSNASEKFARGRLRKVMPALSDEGFTTDSLIELGIRAAEAKEALDHYTKTFLATSAQIEPGGSLRIDRDALRSVPRAIALRALSSCLNEIHENDYAPRHAALSPLLDAVLASDATRTLCGCIVASAGNKITILREPAAAIENLPLRSGETVLWDKRWLVTAENGPSTATIRALGHPPHDLIDLLAPGLRRRVPQGRVRASLPALWAEGEIRAIPSFDEKAALRLVLRKRAFP